MAAKDGPIDFMFLVPLPGRWIHYWTCDEIGQIKTYKRISQAVYKIRWLHLQDKNPTCEVICVFPQLTEFQAADIYKAFDCTVPQITSSAIINVFVPRRKKFRF